MIETTVSQQQQQQPSYMVPGGVPIDTVIPKKEDNLTIGAPEVKFLIFLIEEVTKRGAFHARELKDIGIVYEKLVKILKKEGPATYHE